MVRKSEEKHCFTLRQWAFLLAIIAFIITALLTFGMILGLRHTRDAWELVLNDLNDEENIHSNSVYYNEQQQVEANKKLLHRSQHIVQVMIFLLDIGTIFGCLNQIACGLMVYGISTRSANCILPWLIVSAITYMVAGATLLVAYFDMVPGVYISLNRLILAIGFSTVFLIVWYTMLLYYYTLFRSNCAVKRIGTITPTIMQAYGGYIHKIDDTPIEKKIIV